jgi:molecular chaperone DnaJ
VKGETITLAGEDGKPFKVKIPAGVADGQKIRLRGRGRRRPTAARPATSS